MVKESTALEIIPSFVNSTHSKLVPAAEGCIKIRLSFLTFEPKHVRSQMLREIYHSHPPFIEDVCVLMPCMKVFSLIETFFPVFARLQEMSVVPESANLVQYQVLDEDSTTLSYLFD